jgi:hypothetical protein
MEVEMRSILKRRWPSAPLVISLIALFVSIGGIGYAATKIGTSDIKNGAVTAKKLHKNAVKTGKIASGAVTSGKFFLRRLGDLDFDSIAGPSCDSLDVDATGIQPTDFVVVTPPPGYPNTFTLEGHPLAAGDAVALVACNTFDGGGSVDPDGTGGLYKLLVIRY